MLVMRLRAAAPLNAAHMCLLDDHNRGVRRLPEGGTSMSEPSVVLLKDVREKRQRAEKVRRLARMIGNAQAARQLQDYADELDRLAAEREREAAVELTP